MKIKRFGSIYCDRIVNVKFEFEPNAVGVGGRGREDEGGGVVNQFWIRIEPALKFQ